MKDSTRSSAVDSSIDQRGKRLHDPALSNRAFAIFFIVTILIALGLLLAPKAGAASTWTGGGTPSVNWSTGANWGGTAPASANTTDLIFAGTTNTGSAGTPLNQDIATPMVFRSITFGATAGNFFLGGAALAYDGGTATSITQSSSNSQNIANAIGFTGSNANTTLTLTGNGAGVVTVTGPITQSNGQRLLGISKSGTSTFALSGANTYSLGTTVSAGTLLANNSTVSATSSSTGVGTVAVNNTGTLGGTGTVSTALGGAITINGGGQITGNTAGTIGTLTLQNNVTFTGASGSLSQYLVDLSAGANNSDRLTVGGTLSLATLFDQINFSGTPDGTSSYLLASATLISGTFDNVSNLPSGYSLVYTTSTLTLVPVPEPATWITGALVLGLIGWSQRKRFARKRKL